MDLRKPRNEDVVRNELLKMIAEEMNLLDTSKADEWSHIRSEIICNLSGAYANLEALDE